MCCARCTRRWRTRRRKRVRTSSRSSERSSARRRPRPSRGRRFARSRMMIPTRSEPAPSRLGRALVVAAALVAGALMPARAQLVLLRIQPRVGDTMYTRFEQSVEMVGTRNIHSIDTTMTSRMDMMILSHSTVQASDKHGTTVLAITDSVTIEGHGTGATAPTETIRHAMQGRQAKLHIARDGSAELLGGVRRRDSRGGGAVLGNAGDAPREARVRRLVVGAHGVHSREPGERLRALRARAHDVPARFALVEQPARLHLDPRHDLARQRRRARVGIAARGVDGDRHRSHDDGPEARLVGAVGDRDHDQEHRHAHRRARVLDAGPDAASCSPCKPEFRRNHRFPRVWLSPSK